MNTPSSIICRVSGLPFTVSEAEVSMLERISKHNLHLGAPLPLPTIHPVEVVRRLHLFGNFYHIYRAQSVVSGRSLLTRFDPARGVKVCTLDEFWTDTVDNRSVGAEVDFSRPFFPQWKDLLWRSTIVPFNNYNVEGSDYVSGATNVKNCYLCFSVLNSQDCLYCMHQYNGNDNVYCIGSDHSQWCYGCIEIDGCYECQECEDCHFCSQCFFSLDCRSCKNCFGCVGLRQKEFCFYNEQLSEVDYRARVSELCLSSRAARGGYVARVLQLATSIGHQVERIVNCENCTGAYLRRCENLEYCFHGEESKDCSHVIVCHHAKDCWNGYSIGSELTYAAGTVNTFNGHYSYGLWSCENVWYSFFMFNNCSDCFGCVGLKKANYCILNRQYSKEEYLDLLPRVVALMQKHGEWGEFFSPAMAPHRYHESAAAALFYPLSDEILSSRGHDTTPVHTHEANQNALPGEDLPDDIQDVDIASLMGKTIRCPESRQLYSFQRKELEFYKKLSIPLPKGHWRTRIMQMNSHRAAMKDDRS